MRLEGSGGASFGTDIDAMIWAKNSWINKYLRCF